MGLHRTKSPGPIRFPFDCSDGKTRTCIGQRKIDGVRVLLADDSTTWVMHPTVGQLAQPYDGEVNDDEEDA